MIDTKEQTVFEQIGLAEHGDVAVVTGVLVEKENNDQSARSKIVDLERRMKQGETVDLPPVHHFAPGVYARELFIPAGTIIIGKIHRTEHLNILSKGRIAVFTESGGYVEMKAPCHIVSKPGTKRVGYAIEDTVWTTIHPTNETDLEKLEADLVCDSFEQLEVKL